MAATTAHSVKRDILLFITFAFDQYSTKKKKKRKPFSFNHLVLKTILSVPQCNLYILTLNQIKILWEIHNLGSSVFRGVGD